MQWVWFKITRTYLNKIKYYPALHGSSTTVEGQYEPAAQNVSSLLRTSDHTSAPPHVWFGFPGGIWYVYL